MCNAMFPFDRCAAHLGDDGWGNGSVSFGDLQLRVYVLDGDVAQQEVAIRKRGLREAKRIHSESARHQRGLKGRWFQERFSYRLSYSDYGGTAHVDVRITEHHNGVVAFVFMYAAQRHLESIEDILDSFE